MKSPEPETEPAKPGRMRHPVRNEFDRIKKQLEYTAGLASPDAAMARLMLATLPVYCDFLEAERDAGTPGPYQVHAVTCLASNVLGQSIQAIAPPGQAQQVLIRTLTMIHEEIRGRLGGPVNPTHSSIIMPGA